MKNLLLVAGIFSMLTVSAFAEPLLLKSNFNPEAGPNEYVVTFPPEFGSSQIFMPIVGGAFEIQVDADAGTSSLLSWTQNITPIDIFGMSTGPILISLVPGTDSAGTFDAETQEFDVAATFRIEFDDTQLREVGFISPVELVGTEKGRIFGVGSIGTIRMLLDGEGLFAGGAFNYTCKTTATFDSDLTEGQVQPGDVNQDRNLTVTDPIAIIGSLFQDVPVKCPLAREVNEDGILDLSDAVYLLNYLFLGGEPTPADPVPCSS